MKNIILCHVYVIKTMFVSSFVVENPQLWTPNSKFPINKIGLFKVSELLFWRLVSLSPAAARTALDKLRSSYPTTKSARSGPRVERRRPASRQRSGSATWGPLKLPARSQSCWARSWRWRRRRGQRWSSGRRWSTSFVWKRKTVAPALTSVANCSCCCSTPDQCGNINMESIIWQLTKNRPLKSICQKIKRIVQRNCKSF